MKNALKILLLTTSLLPTAASACYADGFELYWGPGYRHDRPSREYRHDLELWHAGSWVHGWHGDRDGWWWVVGDRWHLYAAPVYPYPDLYAPPVYVAPAMVVVEQAPTAVIATPAPAVGTEVHFAAPAPAAIEAASASATFIDKHGRTCRKYETTILLDGVSQPAYGTACLQPDGSWHEVK
jgi:hypothetical protein